MSYNDTVPVIPFDVNYDVSNIEFIKHERVTLDNNGNEDKVNECVPRLSEEAEPIEILMFLTAFQ